MATNVLKASDLAKSYKSRQVVRDVSMQVKSGEIVGLLGPNGAGKTTSFYMMVGLTPCDSGNIYLNTTNITHYPMHNRARVGIGYLPQEPSIFRKLSVAQNINAILELQKDLSRNARKSKLESLLQEFHLDLIANNLGISLSGGERRRVEIARAVAANPAFMLLDEPFAGVDPISVIDIKQIVQHLSERGIGVLITDHNVRETLDLCERAYIMGHGQLIAEGSPNTILQSNKVKEIYLGEHFRM